MNTEKIIKDIFFGNLHEAKDDIASLLLQKVGYALEEKKKRLDPVGEGDDDIDNDGDSDESDEYLKNRRKKISKAVKEQYIEPFPGDMEYGNPDWEGSPDNPYKPGTPEWYDWEGISQPYHWKIPPGEGDSHLETVRSFLRQKGDPLNKQYPDIA